MKFPTYSLEDIYQEGMEDFGAGHPKGFDGKQGIIKLGILLYKYPSGAIEILNTTKGGDYFQELTSKEYQHFYNHGWKKGVLLTSLGNYERKIKIIEGRIQSEMNSRKNDKYIKRLKNSREKIMRKYSERKQQLLNLN